jgi:hypothetical protein
MKKPYSTVTSAFIVLLLHVTSHFLHNRTHLYSDLLVTGRDEAFRSLFRGSIFVHWFFCLRQHPVMLSGLQWHGTVLGAIRGTERSFGESVSLSIFASTECRGLVTQMSGGGAII